jgi:hypothetical protein
LPGRVASCRPFPTWVTAAVSPLGMQSLQAAVRDPRRPTQRRKLGIFLPW